MMRKSFTLLVLFSLSAWLFSLTGTQAQTPDPPYDPKPSPQGELFPIPGDPRTRSSVGGLSPQETGGPDEFGYTWDDSAAFNWIDASGGTKSDLTGDDRWDGPIDMGFDFKFYENTYSQLYFSTNGLITFGAGASEYLNQNIPNPSSPNDFIAPFWDDLCVNYGTYNTGAIHYLRGGTAPHRYFVVEWRAVSRLGETDLLTFEAVLYESGDILMQYQTMDGYLDSATVGIEENIGVDGLEYGKTASSGVAIRFARPGAAARIKTWPIHQGQFASAGEDAAFEIPIHNTGELGADTYDISASSPWTVTLYAADGITPLSDTDDDGTVDTGPVDQGSIATVVARITAPGEASVGDQNTASITARSSLDADKSRTVTLRTAIPAPFAQVFRDDADGAMSLYLVQPSAQTLKKTSDDWHWGYNMAVAETPNSFAYVWHKGRNEGSVYVSEIEYTLLDSQGNTVRGVTKLTDHTGATMQIYDNDPVVAVAPDGRIGLTWYRYLYNSSNYTWNYNVYYAILDATGAVIVPPTNLTNNPIWGSSGSSTPAPQFRDPRIAATDDNRFVLAWQRYINTDSGSLDDIYYTIRDTNGGIIRPITQLTADTPGYDEGYQHPNLTRLSGNRVLFVWYRNSDYYTYYTVLDSAGNPVKEATSTGSYGWRSDAVQLSNDRIVIASEGIQFVVLDGTTYDVIAGPTWLYNPASLSGNDYVSVAADTAGHAILTWTEYDWNARHVLYYALVDGDGNILTNPMIFRRGQTSTPHIETSLEGYGNTSWSVDTTPPTNPISLTSTSHITDTWSSDDTVDVAWSGASDAESGLDGYSVAWDHAPTTVPDAVKEMEETVQNTTSDPLADGDWYFHIRAVDHAGNGADGAAHIGPFRIDTMPPQSTAESPEYAFGPFQVDWSGSDGTSGIVSYDVEVRDGANGTWVNWQPDTPATSATYTDTVTGHTYYFRSVARDAAGHVEADLPADGDTHTTIAASQVTGQVVNNRDQPIWNATVSAQPAALNVAATDQDGGYTLYFDASGAYSLTASRDGFGALPPLRDLMVNQHREGVDFVLPPAAEGVRNGGWESGTLDDWHSSPGVTHTVETTAAHTGHYGLVLRASGGTLAFWPYVTQTVRIPSAWTQPTLSFLYRVVEGRANNALQAVVVGEGERMTYTIALASSAWTHVWRDLSGFTGQTVTLQFGFQEQTTGQQVHLDEVSVGETRAGIHSIYLPLVMRNS